MTKTMKIRRVMTSFCQIVLQNLIKISTEVYELKPFEMTILVKSDFGGQVKFWKKWVIDPPLLIKILKTCLTQVLFGK